MNITQTLSTFKLNAFLYNRTRMRKCPRGENVGGSFGGLVCMGKYPGGCAENCEGKISGGIARGVVRGRKCPKKCCEIFRRNVGGRVWDCSGAVG